MKVTQWWGRLWTPFGESARRTRWGRVFYWLFALSVYGVLLAYNLRSTRWSQDDLERFTKDHYVSEFNAYDSYQRGVEDPEPFERPLGALTQLQAKKGGRAQPASGTAASYSFRVGINWPILALATLAYLTSAWALLYTIDLLGDSFGGGRFATIPAFDPGNGGPKLSWAIYKSDIENAQKFAEQLERRSVLFLGIGSVVALIGVAGVVMLFPQEARINEPTAQLILRMARPLGLTVFIETIAWYFLKQSRVLIEDHRSFYRMYLKRANYLAALGLLPDDRKDAPELTAAVLWSVLHDPVSDRLAQGETTEALETMRAMSELPFASFAKTVFDKATGPSSGTAT